MTKKVQVEIFDSLMAGAVALCQNKNYFAGSPLYKDMVDTKSKSVSARKSQPTYV
jgi:hypothetical protein